MRNVVFDNIVQKLIRNDFAIEASDQLSEEERAFLTKHPQWLHKLTDSQFIKKEYLHALLVISLTMMTVAKVIEHSGWLTDFPVLHDIASNLLFSLAMEMLGATTVAYFLEVLFERRMGRNQRLLGQLLRSDGDRGQPPDSANSP